MAYSLIYSGRPSARGPSALLISNHWPFVVTHCERLSAMHYHIPVTRIFGLKFLECPHSSISGVLVWSTPPLPQMKIWARLELVWNNHTPPCTPPPPMKIWARLVTLDLSWFGSTPPPGVCRLIAVSPTDTVSLV